jgi:hypothetical protein
MSRLDDAVTLASVMERTHGRGAVIEESLLYVPASEAIEGYSKLLDKAGIELLTELLRVYNPSTHAVVIQSDGLIQAIELSKGDKTIRNQIY